MADILIYSTAICPYCVAAKSFLKSKGWQYREVRIDLDREAMATMLATAKRSSVPQIFINDVHIGGYDDLIALHRRGGLEPMLEATV